MEQYPQFSTFQYT
uniref:Uncharacterized protein n=1 Tax=Lepeophtheirus salmonis TaxID=72036 RepID=A0A0K2UYS0_LEPSM